MKKIITGTIDLMMIAPTVIAVEIGLLTPPFGISVHLNNIEDWRHND